MESPGSRWQQLGQDIDGEADLDQSGKSVALSTDGKTLAIGANDNGVKGNVRVYHMRVTGLGWNQLGQYIDGEARGDHADLSVHLSSGGNTIAIGAMLNDDKGDQSWQLLY